MDVYPNIVHNINASPSRVFQRIVMSSGCDKFQLVILQYLCPILENINHHQVSICTKGGVVSWLQCRTCGLNWVRYLSRTTSLVTGHVTLLRLPRPLNETLNRGSWYLRVNARASKGSHTRVKWGTCCGHTFSRRKGAESQYTLTHYSELRRHRRTNRTPNGCYYLDQWPRLAY
jgi:hypothetical protein